MKLAHPKTISGNPLSKIGIGTFGVGGRGHRDVQLTELQDDEVYSRALVHALNKGSNFTEISLGYGHGNALRLFKTALDQSAVRRENLFITHSFYVRDLPDMATIRRDANAFYKLMGTEYADSILVTQSILLQFGESAIYRLLHELLDTRRTRYVSLSNASPNWIRKFKHEFGDAFFAHEGHLSFEVRALQDKGVFKTCDELGVRNIIWRPLRRNKTLRRNWPLLIELSGKYQRSQSQIVLNWMCQLGYMPMVFSTNKEHIEENLAATEFVMEAEDYNRITGFRPDNVSLPSIDWEGQRIDDDIVRLANEFEVSARDSLSTKAIGNSRQ